MLRGIKWRQHVADSRYRINEYFVLDPMNCNQIWQGSGKIIMISLYASRKFEYEND